MRIISDFNTSVQKALTEINPKWRNLPGLVICGTHTPEFTDQLLFEVQQAREDGTPFYGECFGYQIACIEWARNVMGIRDATSEEFGEGTLVVTKRPEMKVGLHDGESWWSNYEVREDVAKDFSEKKPAHMFAVPYHPSYQSSKEKPHPILKAFLKYAMAA